VGAACDSYPEERRSVAVDTLHHVEAQTRIANTSSPVGILLHDLVLRAATATGLLDRVLVPRINQLDVAYQGSAVQRRAGLAGRLDRVVGRRLPDVDLLGRGGATTLHEVLRERAQPLHELLGLILGNEGVAVRDQFQAAARKQPLQLPRMLEWHQAVLRGPHHESRSGEVPDLLRPVQQDGP
jgi:hypothetical protein